MLAGLYPKRYSPDAEGVAIICWCWIQGGRLTAADVLTGMYGEGCCSAGHIRGCLVSQAGAIKMHNNPVTG